MVPTTYLSHEKIPGTTYYVPRRGVLQVGGKTSSPLQDDNPVLAASSEASRRAQPTSPSPDDHHTTVHRRQLYPLGRPAVDSPRSLAHRADTRSLRRPGAREIAAVLYTRLHKGHGRSPWHCRRPALAAFASPLPLLPPLLPLSPPLAGDRGTDPCAADMSVISSIQPLRRRRVRRETARLHAAAAVARSGSSHRYPTGPRQAHPTPSTSRPAPDISHPSSARLPHPLETPRRVPAYSSILDVTGPPDAVVGSDAGLGCSGGGRAGRRGPGEWDGKSALPGELEDVDHAADVDLADLVVRPAHPVVDDRGRVAGV